MSRMLALEGILKEIGRGSSAIYLGSFEPCLV